MPIWVITKNSASIGVKCEHLYKFLADYFKNHTLIMPTFTYSFCKTGIFNVQKSRSKLVYFQNILEKNVETLDLIIQFYQFVVREN